MLVVLRAVHAEEGNAVHPLQHAEQSAKAWLTTGLIQIAAGVAIHFLLQC